jgi:hypothetical protein
MHGISDLETSRYSELVLVSLSSQTTHSPPLSNLLVRPDSRCVCLPTRLGSDEGSLGDNKGTWNACALCIVFQAEVTVLMVGVCAVACQRRHYDAMLEANVAHLFGLEESCVS